MIDVEQTRESDDARRKRVWPPIMMVLVLTVLALGASGVGISYLFADDPSQPGTAEVTDPEAVATATGGNEPVGVETPSFLAGDEPIADAAEVILPSVVQLQTPDGGVGSGVIYDSNGLILTAAHVVEGSDTVIVRFSDGEEVVGTVIGGAAEADVGVIEVDRTGLPAATLALDESPRVGQLAIAVGSPWGLQSTVTAGIVSAVNQAIDCRLGGSCRSMLQTDAAINPGNSGGALVDRFGRVLGINVSIFTLSGANDGVGFAVPIDIAYDIAERLVAGESLASAYLGVTGSDVETGQAGALITEVQPETGADEAGVRVDDLVISIGGVRVQGIADLASQVRSHRPGTTVDLVVVRDGVEVDLVVTLGELASN